MVSIPRSNREDLCNSPIMQSNNSNDNKFDGELSAPDEVSLGGMSFLVGNALDDYFFLCPCSPSLRHRADLAVLGDHSTDHSLSLREETIVQRHFSTEG